MQSSLSKAMLPIPSKQFSATMDNQLMAGGFPTAKMNGGPVPPANFYQGESMRCLPSTQLVFFNNLRASISGPASSLRIVTDGALRLAFDLQLLTVILNQSQIVHVPLFLTTYRLRWAMGSEVLAHSMALRMECINHEATATKVLRMIPKLPAHTKFRSTQTMDINRLTEMLLH